ncbi:lanthionine synthetase LanC family protein [Tissierella pigra]|uniref:Protein kinase/lanthionine synthetase C family protein n=1 Tax=Tissierella pigra TaxID=2607614 RepID=A0A6N7XU13_9FIRM|nr:lanthionine synthetase LanC family protein [Tissierella pigra]MSU01267.1 protein kinase/lanthionine synthetase C family protein [Tissierella pigra]
MITDLLLYSIENNKFYEDFSKKNINKEFIDILLHKIDCDWKIEKRGIYHIIYQNLELPSQGWKIHISATLENAEDILDIVASILIPKKIAFKVLLDIETLKVTSQKSFPRQSYGKFITIYPKNLNEFKQVIDLLYIRLRQFEGPYILSDKRYKDCKVIYYRYGGFLSNYEYDNEGNSKPCIIDGYNRKIEDLRVPYFKLPPGINDVFTNFENNSKSQLTERYKVIKAIRFTNAGGVYLGEDIKTKELVVIKEARPHTVLIGDGKDAIYIRKEEVKRLKEFELTGYVPKVIDYFYDWEHFFTIVEYIDGEVLDEFVIRNNPIYRMGTGVQVQDYLKKIIKIFIKLSDFISILHKNKYIFGDFALDNFMITLDLDIKAIDLEGCNREGSLTQRAGTKGFFETMRHQNLYESDIYSLGCLLFSCILKKNNMIDIKKDTFEVFLDSVLEEYNVPVELKLLILNMTSSEYNQRPCIEEVIYKLKDILYQLENKQIERQDINFKNVQIQDSLAESIKLGIKGILSSKNKTSLCIFPNTPLLNSKLNVSTGLFGIIRGLNYLGVKAFNKEFINSHLKFPQNEPMGLYVGIAGVLWTLLDIKELEKAEMLFDQHIDIYKLGQDYSIFSGKSGIGLLCLKFYIITQDKMYLELAVKIGDNIIKDLEIDQIKNIGYKKGLSGISLFLLYLYIVSGDNRYILYGKDSLLLELNYQVSSNIYATIDFPGFIGSNIASPYFIEGTSGILSVLLRYYKILKEPYLLEKSVELANSFISKYSISPTLYSGLSGMGNVLLDSYYILGDDKYKKQAYDFSRGCLLHQIKYENGILFPDLYINKLSTDFGYGTIGILMFFERLVKDKSQNFCFFLDELLI